MSLKGMKIKNVNDHGMIENTRPITRNVNAERVTDRTFPPKFDMIGLVDYRFYQKGLGNHKISVYTREYGTRTYAMGRWSTMPNKLGVLGTNAPRGNPRPGPKHTLWAGGLGVLTLPLQGKDRRFNSASAHQTYFIV